MISVTLIEGKHGSSARECLRILRGYYERNRTDDYMLCCGALVCYGSICAQGLYIGNNRAIPTKSPHIHTLTFPPTCAS